MKLIEKLHTHTRILMEKRLTTPMLIEHSEVFFANNKMLLEGTEGSDAIRMCIYECMYVDSHYDIDS